MQNQIIANIERPYLKNRPNFQVGDKVSVSLRLKEGDKERIQVFRGVVILKTPKSGNTPGATFTVRKISEGVGVERVFPIHSPFIESITVESSSKVRRSRLFYLRNLRGKKARLKESTRFGELVIPASNVGASVEGSLTSSSMASSEGTGSTENTPQDKPAFEISPQVTPKSGS